MKDYKHVFVAGSESGWRAELKGVLESWIDCLDRYMSDDLLGKSFVPFWYNERAQVSLLAAAAWRRGIAAVEEFRTRKGEDRSAVRGDLMMRFGEALVCCECKLHRRRLGVEDNPWNLMPRALTKAVRDAREVSLPGVPLLVRTGIVFFSPKIPSQDAERFEELRQSFLDEVEARRRQGSFVVSRDGQPADFWAAFFPVQAATARHVEGGSNRWPGILLCGATLEDGPAQ